jgi:hypothetical protein
MPVRKLLQGRIPPAAVALIVVLTALIVVAGCGSGDSSTESTGSVAAKEGGEGGKSNGGAASGGEAEPAEPGEEPSGGEGSSSAGAGTPAKLEGEAAAFVAGADKICGERKAETRSGLQKYRTEGNESFKGIANNAVTIVNQIVNPGLVREKKEIQKLSVPADAEQAAATLFAAIDKMLVAGKADPKRFILIGDVVKSSEEEARKAGFKVCGGI